MRVVFPPRGGAWYMGRYMAGGTSAPADGQALRGFLDCLQADAPRPSWSGRQPGLEWTLEWRLRTSPFSSPSRTAPQRPNHRARASLGQAGAPQCLPAPGTGLAARQTGRVGRSRPPAAVRRDPPGGRVRLAPNGQPPGNFAHPDGGVRVPMIEGIGGPCGQPRSGALGVHESRPGPDQAQGVSDKYAQNRSGYCEVIRTSLTAISPKEQSIRHLKMPTVHRRQRLSTNIHSVGPENRSLRQQSRQTRL